MSAIDLRCGDWRDVLADVECDALITDVPYSERTVTGQRSFQNAARYETAPTIAYAPWSRADCHEFVSSWVPRVRRWLVVCCDHVIAGWLEEDCAAAGLYTFAPLPWCKTDAAPRFMCDGPSPSSETIFVARPRRVLARPEKRCRRGWYMTAQERAGCVTGAKPLALMRALVRDYSEPRRRLKQTITDGDVVCDPFAGGATTLIAATIEGRRAVGSEMDPKTFALAQARIKRGYTPTFTEIWGDV